jgi:hypothetical protein
MSLVDCLHSQIIPANPDIAGVGIRVAIYIQNLLSFIPAFFALLDGKISVKELETVEKQSTTILITAFAVLISATFFSTSNTRLIRSLVTRWSPGGRRGFIMWLSLSEYGGIQRTMMQKH